MADDLKQTGKADNTRINVDQDHEVKYWSEKFGVSRDELRSAVAKAGPMVKDIQAHLGHQGAEQRWNDEGGNLQTAESRQRK